ncbi:trigger factor [Caloramator sp. E03]|uniref:trigger factor n=1 Tax=Caloramator sp. E03 TaxID=2576307 RepID=UPI0011104892|nr:trigger factor [Caloramator sp. E03]QCX33078.1 trigger factor [Caloramator sp. E03]
MNTKVEKVENNKVKLEITVSAQDFQEALKKSYNKNVGKFNIPGFRKGKAPMAIIEKYYGIGVFYEDAVQFVCDDTYPKAIEENNLDPVDYPEIDIVQIDKNKDFIYTATVTVKPEVKLGEYKGVEVEKVEYKVSDEDVDTELNLMRDKNARILTKEGKIENGDIAVIDFEGFIDGVPFEGGKADNYQLTIGSGTFIPGFEDQLVGVAAGNTVDVNVTFPEDYHEESLKGKPALFKVTVKEVKYKELPELDDEFAKDVSEFDTLDELKQDIRKKLEEENALKAKKEYEDKVINKVVEAAEVDIPDVMIEKEIDFMINDFSYRLKYQGLDIKKYAELIGTTVEGLREQFKEPAKQRVKNKLVLEAIAKAENIKASEDEIEKRAEEIAKYYGSKDLEKMKEAILMTEKNIIEDEIVNNKVIDFVVESSKAI